MMDSRLLKKNQDFKELKDTYVIFICQHDKYKENKPIYHVDKIIRETGKAFDDGAHIIYVNGKYRGEDDFGKFANASTIIHNPFKIFLNIKDILFCCFNNAE